MHVCCFEPQSLEAALAESRLEVAQLSSLREEAARAEESAALATTLQASRRRRIVLWGVVHPLYLVAWAIGHAAGVVDRTVARSG